MKIAVLAPKDSRFQGSRYKYTKLMEQFAKVEYVMENHERHVKTADALVVYGDKRDIYKVPVRHGRKYLLIEHDVATLRGLNFHDQEREMVQKAGVVLTTSEDHADYLLSQYGIESTTIHLRPLKSMLNYKTLPKLQGNTLCYCGGLFPWGSRTKRFGYRSYHKIFEEFTKRGWRVHIYPTKRRKLSVEKEYKAIGCEFRESQTQDNLYRQLSQYTAGFQGYNKIDVPEIVYNYSQSCRPNKLWEYLASGIPTIGFQGGNGMKIYDGGWGVALNSLDELDNLQLPVITKGMQEEQVMDNDVELLRTCIERVAD